MSTKTLSAEADCTAVNPFCAVAPSGRAYLLAAALLGAALLALTIDVPVARFCLAVETSGQIDAIKFFRDVRKLLSLAEVFGHGYGVALICLAWFALDVSRRWSLPRVLACAYGAGILADICKLLVGRTRPREFDFSGGVASTFLGFLPVFTGESYRQAFERGIQSLPSGHSATAAGLAVILSSFYPHARWFFAMLAALVLLQRVESRAHFVSDTLAGAAIGCLFAGICLDRRLLGRFFNMWEPVPQVNCGTRTNGEP